MCCCFLLLVLGLAVGVYFYVSNLNISLATVIPPDPTNVTIAGSSSLVVPFGIVFSVTNKNPFGFKIDEIHADVFYPLPGNNTAPRQIANGTLDSIQVPASTNPAQAVTNITFPVTAVYGPDTDPNFSALSDMLTKCGLLGQGQKTPITLNIRVTIRERILFASPSFSIERPITMPCPLPNDITSNPLVKQVMQQVNATISALLN